MTEVHHVYDERHILVGGSTQEISLQHLGLSTHPEQCRIGGVWVDGIPAESWEA